MNKQKTNSKTLTNDFAIASIIMGIVSFIHILSIEKAIVAIVFGILALRRIKENKLLDGKKLAIIGIVLGIIYLAVGIYLIVFMLQPLVEKMHQQLQYLYVGIKVRT